MKQLVAIVAYYMFGYLIFWTFLHETDLFPKVWVQDNFSIATFVMSYMYNWHNSSKSDAINGLRYHWLISYVS